MTPSRRRPLTNIQRNSRRSSSVSPGDCTQVEMPIVAKSAIDVIGIQRSGPGIGGMP